MHTGSQPSGRQRLRGQVGVGAGRKSAWCRVNPNDWNNVTGALAIMSPQDNLTAERDASTLWGLASPVVHEEHMCATDFMVGNAIMDVPRDYPMRPPATIGQFLYCKSCTLALSTLFTWMRIFRRNG
jgi:hypothetical protein